jgi:uncharacterized membrane protein YfcA
MTYFLRFLIGVGFGTLNAGFIVVIMPAVVTAEPFRVAAALATAYTLGFLTHALSSRLLK